MQIQKNGLMFLAKVGDKVMCVDANDTHDQIKRNQIYEVVGHFRDKRNVVTNYYLKGVPSGFMIHRFKQVDV